MSATKNKLIKRLSCTGYSLLCALVSFVVLWGCATVPRETNTLVIVDGEAITVDDLIYSLTVSHRIEDLSSAGQLDISGFIQRLIDELLIVQEARRMGIEDHPVTRKKVDAFIVRESVIKLYKDEILEKSFVSEAEIRERFRRDYERVTLGIIALNSQKDASDILERLQIEEDFEKLAREHSVDYSQDGGEKTLKRKEMVPLLKTAVVDLIAGEISDVIHIKDNFFYIVKLIKRQEAAEEEFENVSKNIKEQISKSKIQKRSDEYVAELRAEAGIEIDRELLKSFELGAKESLENHLKDERVLVKINDTVLTAGEFATSLVQSKTNSMENLLNNWIAIKVVDREALRRGYATKTGLKEHVRRYKNRVIFNSFVNKMVLSDIRISGKEIEDYYIVHKEDFVKPRRYRIQQITLETLEDAQGVLKSLGDGASFSWLAKRSSKDEFASKSGAAGWIMKDNLSANAAEMIDTLKPGEISPVFEADNYFRVIRLQEKSETDFEEFGAVKEIIRKRMFKERYNKIYNEYVDQLKNDANIKVYEEAVESYKARFKK